MDISFWNGFLIGIISRILFFIIFCLYFLQKVNKRQKIWFRNKNSNW